MKPIHSIIAITVTWTGWFSVFATLIWIMLFFITGEQITLVRWVSYVLPWLAGLLFFEAVISAFIKRKYLSISLALLSLWLFVPYIHLFIPSSHEIPAGQPVYKVMTYSKMGRNRDIQAVSNVVLSEKPDILFMQEINTEDSEKLVNRLSNMYNGQPVQYYADPFKGLILSRFPIMPKIQNGDYSLAAEVDIDGIRVSVWNVHLQKSITDTKIQDKMITQLVEQVSTTTGPMIVSGDFNTTEINYPYLIMKKYLNNAFELAGFGFGFTFPTASRRSGLLTSFMRIDHIFYSHDFMVLEAKVLDDSGGSDHYPLYSLVSFNN